MNKLLFRIVCLILIPALIADPVFAEVRSFMNPVLCSPNSAEFAREALAAHVIAVPSRGLVSHAAATLGRLYLAFGSMSYAGIAVKIDKSQSSPADPVKPPSIWGLTFSDVLFLSPATEEGLRVFLWSIFGMGWVFWISGSLLVLAHAAKYYSRSRAIYHLQGKPHSWRTTARTFLATTAFSIVMLAMSSAVFYAVNIVMDGSSDAWWIAGLINGALHFVLGFIWWLFFRPGVERGDSAVMAASIWDTGKPDSAPSPAAAVKGRMPAWMTSLIAKRRKTRQEWIELFRGLAARVRPGQKPTPRALAAVTKGRLSAQDIRGVLKNYSIRYGEAGMMRAIAKGRSRHEWIDYLSSLHGPIPGGQERTPETVAPLTQGELSAQRIRVVLAQHSIRHEEAGITREKAEGRSRQGWIDYLSSLHGPVAGGEERTPGTVAALTQGELSAQGIRIALSNHAIRHEEAGMTREKRGIKSRGTAQTSATPTAAGYEHPVPSLSKQVFFNARQQIRNGDWLSQLLASLDRTPIKSLDADPVPGFQKHAWKIYRYVNEVIRNFGGPLQAIEAEEYVAIVQFHIFRWISANARHQEEIPLGKLWDKIRYDVIAEIAHSYGDGVYSGLPASILFPAVIDRIRRRTIGISRTQKKYLRKAVRVAFPAHGRIVLIKQNTNFTDQGELRAAVLEALKGLSSLDHEKAMRALYGIGNDEGEGYGDEKTQEEVGREDLGGPTMERTQKIVAAARRELRRPRLRRLLQPFLTLVLIVSVAFTGAMQSPNARVLKTEA